MSSTSNPHYASSRNASTETPLKIAVVDLLLRWPPDGGARVEMIQLIRHLAARHNVRVFVPRLDDDPAQRGRFADLPDGIINLIEIVPLTRQAFVRGEFEKRAVAAVEAWRPDRVIVGDGWHSKVRLMSALRKWRPIVRFFAHEGLCLKGHGHRFVNEAACNYCYLSEGSSFNHCLSCFRIWHSQTTTKVFEPDIEAAGLPGSTEYADLLRNALSAAGAVIVYNRAQQHMLQPFTGTAIISPGGIAPEDRAAPRVKKPSALYSFLMPSRTGDYLKGLHVLLAAGAILYRTRRDFVITITGKPAPGVTPPPFADYKGWQNREELKELINKAVATVHPAVWPEPFGIAALESMAQGTPAIASDTGGLGDLIRDTGGGWLFQPGNAEELAILMNHVMNDPADAATKAGLGFDASERYEWNKVFAASYDALIDGN